MLDRRRCASGGRLQKANFPLSAVSSKHSTEVKNALLSKPGKRAELICEIVSQLNKLRARSNYSNKEMEVAGHILGWLDDLDNLVKTQLEKDGAAVLISK